MKVGRPDAKDTKVGALISKEHLEKVIRFRCIILAKKKQCLNSFALQQNNYGNSLIKLYLKLNINYKFLVDFRD